MMRWARTRSVRKRGNETRRVVIEDTDGWGSEYDVREREERWDKSKRVRSGVSPPSLLSHYYSNRDRV
jgi:hypothetical protein